MQILLAFARSGASAGRFSCWPRCRSRSTSGRSSTPCLGREQKWHVTGSTTAAASPFNFIIPQVLTFVFLLLTAVVGVWQNGRQGRHARGGLEHHEHRDPRRLHGRGLAGGPTPAPVATRRRRGPPDRAHVAAVSRRCPEPQAGAAARGLATDDAPTEERSMSGATGSTRIGSASCRSSPSSAGLHAGGQPARPAGVQLERRWWPTSTRSAPTTAASSSSSTSRSARGASGDKLFTISSLACRRI